MRFIRRMIKENKIDLNKENSKFVGVYGSLFFAVVSAVLTGLNITKEYYSMTIATGVLVVGFMAATICSYKGKDIIQRILTVLMCGFIFSYFALIGGNEGFAILWILLVPGVSFMLVGVKAGFYLCVYFMVFLFAIFYTPLSVFIEDYYSATFIIRFPILYTANFGAMTFLMWQRQKLFDEIDKKSNFDAMTDLYNRGYFMEIYNKIIEEDDYRNLTVVMFDINGLKTANDEIGHEAGDELIITGAKLIKQAFPGDICCRIGGDEYAVVSRKKDVLEKIEKLKKLSESWHGEFVSSISISAGYASADENPGMDIEELTSIADRKMYEDKAKYYEKSGKDRRKNGI